MVLAARLEAFIDLDDIVRHFDFRILKVGNVRQFDQFADLETVEQGDGPLRDTGIVKLLQHR